MTVIPPPYPKNEKQKTKKKKTHPECVGFGVTRRQGLFVCVLLSRYLDFKSSARLYSNEHDVISQQKKKKRLGNNLEQKCLLKMKLSSSSSLMYFKTGAILCSWFLHCGTTSSSWCRRGPFIRSLHKLHASYFEYYLRIHKSYTRTQFYPIRIIYTLATYFSIFSRSEFF